MSLTDVQLRKAKPAERPYKMFDEGGLFVLVTPAGGRLWRMRYRYQGKEKLLSFGAYPEVSLAQAREARDRARAELRADRDRRPAPAARPSRLSPPTRLIAAQRHLFGRSDPGRLRPDRGLGQWDDYRNEAAGLSPYDWGGRVKLVQPKAGGAIASAIGVSGGKSDARMLFRVGIHNIAFAARVGVDVLKPGRNLPLLDIQHVLRTDLDAAFTGVLATHLRLRNV